ncbi:tetratricopeptide repeat protein [Crocosphaera sp.]|uniref:tetratricopeptide repeat protein n=1 Tax=Crocosphaera sp. TaxID=2729996 RepID=UPI00263A195D|nr:tetratricopeptide repeat protein [Crocosphaera sp.]MDJ0582880.1 tetratricopeptide repeat protein [Crocosphaera sp.]
MVEPIINAINNENYEEASKLLQQLQEQESDNIWIPFYQARLAEAKGDFTFANQRYRELLPNIVNPKLMIQIRQGIERINQQEIEQRQTALDQAMEKSGAEEMGMLVLEAIANESKKAAAQKFGEIMGIDAYTARLQLPSRSWRLYRTGAIGKLKFQAEQLQQAEIPCFTALVGHVNALKVYNVLYIESIESKVTMVYEPKKGQREIFTFDLSEVGQQVHGLLPIFEECVDVGLKGKLKRKIEVLDYAKICDLHLPQKQTIIRLCDQQYRFLEGMAFSDQQKSQDGQATMRKSWQHIMAFLSEKITSLPTYSEFTPFGESAIDFQELLRLIKPHIGLLRREETPWDAAFHVYSSLAFTKTFS